MKTPARILIVEDESIVAFNRAYGHFIAFAVGVLALVCLYAIVSFTI